MNEYTCAECGEKFQSDGVGYKVALAKGQNVVCSVKCRNRVKRRRQIELGKIPKMVKKDVLRAENERMRDRLEELEEKILTPQEIVDSCNELAILFYRMCGYCVEPTYKMYEATHPQEKGFWNMAVAAYEHIQGTEVDAVLDEIKGDQCQ